MDYQKLKQELLTPEFVKDHKIPAKKRRTAPAFECKQWWSRGGLESGNSEYEFLAGAHHNRGHAEYEDFQRLHAILLAIGGEETCFPCMEEDMKAILERSYYHNGTSKMMKGRPSQCHGNVCELWQLNHDALDVRICTGYALSSDGLWRQHSWLVHNYSTKTQQRMRIIETTEKRVAYYGFELTTEEAEKFCYFNL